MIKILIAEDEQIEREFIANIVKTSQPEILLLQAENGEEALRLYQEHQPEIVFLDINMPQMSGFDFLEEYNKFPEDVKKKCVIVMLSSSLHPEDREKALSSPYIFEFMSKPINAEKLAKLAII